MNRRLLVIGGALAIVVALLVWWLGRDTEAHPDVAEAAGTHFPDLRPVDGARAEEERTDPAPGKRPSEAEARRQVAEALREAIREARAARTGGAATGGEAAGPGTSTGGSTGESERPGTIDPEYIRDAVRAIRPLLEECYELARDAADREGLEPPEGRLVTRFVFSGEPDVGGVVEESEVLEESSLRDSTLEECLRETLFTLELPAPDEGGTVTVHYPFVFSNAPDDSEG